MPVEFPILNFLSSGIGAGLLGMSFLNRVEIKREGETMVLVKRF